MVLGITGCDIIEKLKDDSSSSIPPIPPVLPDLQFVRPNIDLFNLELTEQSLEDTSGYELASLFINNDFNPFVQSIFNYIPFLEGINQTEPELKNVEWEWIYTHIHQSQNYDIRVISKQKEDSNIRDSWTLFISYSGQDENVENYKLMDITIEKDISVGYWIIYPPEIQDPNANSPPHISLSWVSYNLNNNEEFYFEFLPYSPGSNEGIRADYTKDDISNFEFNRYINMSMENAKFEEKQFHIVWNKNTEEGYVNYTYQDRKQGGSYIETTMCWDENLNNIDCQF